MAVRYARLGEQPAIHASIYDEAPAYAVHSVLSAKVVRLLVAYRMNNRNSAVSHRIQLVQATRLKARGHEQDVTASSDAVGHAHAEPHPPSALVLPMLLHFSEYKVEANISCVMHFAPCTLLGHPIW